MTDSQPPPPNLPPTWEEARGPLARRVRRLARTVRWFGKGALARPRSILLEINWRLGDEIMALPVIDALHRRYPDAAIDVLGNYPDLYDGYPAVRTVNPDHADPDRYVLLRGAPRRVYRLQAYCHKAGVPVPPVRPRLHYASWDSPRLTEIPAGDGPLIALAPGASWPTKRWPAERWQELAGLLERQGNRIMVLGQAGEGLARGTDFCGKTSVGEAARLLQAADLAVCCDSGLMHLALASDTPVVALFGPTDPDYLVRDDPNLTAVRSTDPCHGFWNHAAHVGEPGACPEGHACCLVSISVDRVLRAIDGRLSGEGHR